MLFSCRSVDEGGRWRLATARLLDPMPVNVWWDEKSDHDFTSQTLNEYGSRC
jgi:hypothetical protein